MICDYCGKTHAHIRLVTRCFGKGASLLVIEKIPIVSCPDCGETYLTAETLHRIETIKANRRLNAKKRPVAVTTFA